jgi:hypothetical protein
MTTNLEPTAVESLVRLAGLILSNSSIYGFEHPVTRAIVGDCYTELTALLAACETLAVRVKDGELFVNEVKVSRRNPLVQTFVEHLASREIGEFALAKGITEEEFGKLVEVLDTGAAALASGGGFAQVVHRTGLGKGVLVAAPPVEAAGQISAPPVPSRKPRGGKPAGPDYYTTGKRKLLDFVLGFFGIPSAVAAAAVPLLVLFEASGTDQFGGGLVGLGVLAAAVFAPTRCLQRGRRFIAFGLFSFYGLLGVVPLLALGACLIVLGGMAFG